MNPIVQAQSVTNTKRSEMWSGNLALTVDFGKGWTFKTAGSYNTTNTRADLFYREGSKEAYRNGTVALRFYPYDARPALDQL